MATALWAIGLTLISSFLDSFGALFIKKGSHKFQLKIQELIKAHHLMFGVFLYGLSMVIFIFALRGGELSVLYPIASVTYILIGLWSIKYLNEKMNRFKWVAIILIMLGVSLIGLSS